MIFTERKIKAQSTGDFDGSGRSGIAVYRPSTSTFFVWPATGHIYNVNIGNSDDVVPLTADFDGDGRTDVAVWDPWAGVLTFIPSGSMQPQHFPAGKLGDTPLVGDFDGSGRSGIGIWGGSPLTFSIWPAVGKYFTLQLGQTGDIPMVGDFDGDHIADLTVYRPSNQSFYFLYSSNHTQGGFAIPGGQAGDIPLIADFDASGKTGVAIWRPSTAAFYVYPAVSPAFSYQLGKTGDIPLTADFDGDGKSDLAVWRPSNGVLYYVETSNGSSQSFPAGIPGDVPMPSAPAALSAGSSVVTISGKVLSGNTPVPNASVFLHEVGIGFDTITAADGSYSFTADSGTTAYVTVPSYGFIPASYTFSNITTNQTANFQQPGGAQKSTVYLGNQPIAVSPY